MIHLNLTNEEKDILAEVLENDISDLRMEITDTDNKDFREALKKQKEVLKNVLETLRQTKENTWGK